MTSGAQLDLMPGAPKRRRTRKRKRLLPVAVDSWDALIDNFDTLAGLLEWGGKVPTTRGDCVDGPRPCPWVRCRFHLAIEVNEFGTLRPVTAVQEYDHHGLRHRNIKRAPRGLQSKHSGAFSARIRAQEDEVYNSILDRLWSELPSCALDIADGGEVTQIALAWFLGVAENHRAGIIEARALDAFRHAWPEQLPLPFGEHRG